MNKIILKRIFCFAILLPHEFSTRNLIALPSSCVYKMRSKRNANNLIKHMQTKIIKNNKLLALKTYIAWNSGECHSVSHCRFTKNHSVSLWQCDLDVDTQQQFKVVYRQIFDSLLWCKPFFFGRKMYKNYSDSSARPNHMFLFAWFTVC